MQSHGRNMIEPWLHVLPPRSRYVPEVRRGWNGSPRYLVSLPHATDLTGCLPYIPDLTLPGRLQFLPFSEYDEAVSSLPRNSSFAVLPSRHVSQCTKIGILIFSIVDDFFPTQTDAGHHDRNGLISKG